MGVLHSLNSSLGRATGFQFRRVHGSNALTYDAGKYDAGAPAHEPTQRYGPTDLSADRLLRRPIFILCPPRSGSTLLRLILNGHSALHAPHELHVRRLKVKQSTNLSTRAMMELGLRVGDLEHLLWDRVLHRELTRSGKMFIVDKTPSNAFAWRRIADCWPDAQFLFLLRHPASIARSWHEANPAKRDLDAAGLDALSYMNAVEEARGALPGHTIRYEDLVSDPATTIKSVCGFLEVEWEQDMLDYRDASGDVLKKGLGDWCEKITSGRIQPGREIPNATEVPTYLAAITGAWGYISD